MPFTIECRLNKDFLVAIDMCLSRGDYDQATILGRGLSELIEAEHGDYWGNWMINWRGKRIEAYLASVDMLRELVSEAGSKVSDHLSQHFSYIEGKVREL